MIRESSEMSGVMMTGSPKAQYSPSLIGVQNRFVGTLRTGVIATSASPMYRGMSACGTKRMVNILGSRPAFDMKGSSSSGS